MKGRKGGDSVEAETGMANNHFLVARHYAQGLRAREGKAENIKEIDINTNNRAKKEEDKETDMVEKGEE